MFHRISSPLLALLCLVLSVTCHAQNKVFCGLNIKNEAVDNSELGVVKHVVKGEFMFRKMEKWRIMAFTEKDAERIVDYFLKKSDVIACQSQPIDKTVKIFAERAEDISIEPSYFKEYVQELEEMGYFIIRFHQSKEVVVFPMNNCTAAISIHDFEQEEAIYTKCPPCERAVKMEIEEIENDSMDVEKVKIIELKDSETEKGLEKDAGKKENSESQEKDMKDKIENSDSKKIIENSMVIDGVIDTVSLKTNIEKKKVKE